MDAHLNAMTTEQQLLGGRPQPSSRRRPFVDLFMWLRLISFCVSPQSASASSPDLSGA